MTDVGQRPRFRAILSQKDDKQRNILRAMASILRYDGVREVLVPFDPVEPSGGDRCGTG